MPQGTVKSFDPITKTAVVLDDALNEVLVDRDAFWASGLRELRLGQRVRFELEAEDSQNAASIGIVTL